MWWLLAREVMYLKNIIPRGQPWNVMVDLFFFRDPQEEEKDETEEKGAFNNNALPTQEGSWGNVGENWENTNANESWSNPNAIEGGESWSQTTPTSTWEQQ